MLAAVGAGSVAFGAVFIHLALGARPGTPTVQAGPITGATSLESNRGQVVYSDDFTDSSSGWPVGSTASGTVASYGNPGYMVLGKGSFHHIFKAPYRNPLQQVGVAATATQTSDAPLKAGFGVNCLRGSASSMVRYEFLVLTPGTWYLERFDGAPGAQGRILRQGSSGVNPGQAPITVVGMCADLAGGKTTRLALFVNGVKEVDYIDHPGTADPAGWGTGITTASRDPKPSTVTFIRFEDHDLAS